MALMRGKPEIFNSDQGVQFASNRLHDHFGVARDCASARDGRGRAYRQHLHRSASGVHLKYEDIYLHRYETVPALTSGVTAYLTLYNHERPHQSLDWSAGWRTVPCLSRRMDSVIIMPGIRHRAKLSCRAGFEFIALAWISHVENRIEGIKFASGSGRSGAANGPIQWIE
jgi:hypothetical protein